MDSDDLPEEGADGLWGRKDDGPQFTLPRIPKGFKNTIPQEDLDDLTLVCSYVCICVCVCVCMYV